MKTFVIGHQKPDLDSAVAALAYETLSRKRGEVDQIGVLAGEPNHETKFIFEKFNVLLPTTITSSVIKPENNVILVDHNEERQRLDGLNPDKVIRVIDHHKIKFSSNAPIEVMILPLGSTNTIIWTLFKQSNILIEKDLASLMLCAILSDTVGLKSSTTTETDRQAVADLAIQANISNVEGLTEEIFLAKSDVSFLSDEEVIKNDHKVYDFGKKVLIGKVETIEQEKLLNTRKEGLLKSLQLIKESEKIDYIFLAISDILHINTKLLLLGKEEEGIAVKAFGGQVVNNTLDIGPRLSSKKDIAPPIELVLKI